MAALLQLAESWDLAGNQAQQLEYKRNACLLEQQVSLMLEQQVSLIRNPNPGIRNTKHETRNSKHEIPETRNTKLESRIPNPESLHRKIYKQGACDRSDAAADK